MRVSLCLLTVVFAACPAMATETENLNIRILPPPGKVDIDGKIVDWDLSGGVFVCGDVENQRDNDRRVAPRHVRRGEPLHAGALASMRRR